MSVRKVFGKDAEKLKDMHVVVVGVGGLGCTVANLLARMKIRLTLIDNDIVDDTNLERQTLFEIKDLLRPKVEVAKERLEQFARIDIHNDEMTKENIVSLVGKPDLVIDCTDNVQTRLLINDYCKKNSITWIYSGAVGNIGAIYLVDKDKACYQCINMEKQGDTSCEIGVLNTIVTTVAAIAVNVAINHLVKGKSEEDMIRIADNHIMKIKTKKNPQCSACKGMYNYL